MSFNTLTFTVLINNYNYARFLSRAVESALSQTWPNVQVLFVDDGSKDDSVAVASRYDARNYTVITKPNGGQNSAIAHALPYATGEYTLMLDADDWLAPDACEKIAQELGARRPVGVHFALKKVDPEGKPLGRYPNRPFIAENQRSYLTRYGTIPSSPTSGNAYRTEFVREAFDLLLPDSSFSDGYLAMAAAWTEDVVAIDQELGWYLIHGSNVSQKKKGNDLDRQVARSNTALYHYHNLNRFLMARGAAPKSWHELPDGYTWRDIMYLKLVKGVFQDISFETCRRQGVRRFVVDPHLGAFKRIKNITFLVAGSLIGQTRELFSATAKQPSSA